MTVVVRVVEPAAPVHLGAAGACLVGFAEVVGVCGTGPVVEVVLLGDWGVTG